MSLAQHQKAKKAESNDELLRVMGITPREAGETIIDSAYFLIDHGLVRKLDSYRQRLPHIKLINDYRDILLGVTILDIFSKLFNNINK